MFKLNKLLNASNKLSLSSFNQLIKQNLIYLSTQKPQQPQLSKSKAKKLEDKFKKQIIFYLDNELPDENLENQLKDLKKSINLQRESINSLKKEKATKEKIDVAISELVSNLSIFGKKLEKILVKNDEPSDNLDANHFENFLKDRFIYDQSFSIYGGVSGLFDLGPLGCVIQNNLVEEWKKFFILNDRMHQVDCSLLTPEIALKASGHLAKFSDIMVKDTKTNESFRVDHLLKAEIKKLISKVKSDKSESNNLEEILRKLENSQITDLKEIDEIILKYKIHSPNNNSLSNAAPFNLMFQTEIGSKGQKSYIRPETAQGIFVNFKRLYEFNQRKLPMVVAQIGKSFRNEISPKSGLIRQREFLMAEIEHFIDPDLKYEPFEKFKSVENVEINILNDKTQLNSQNHFKIKLKDAIQNKVIKSETVAYYIGRINEFCKKCGIHEEKIRFRQHLSTEMAHYANECWDLECKTSFGWIECAGIADRSDFDLKQHSIYSGQNLLAEKYLKSTESANKKDTKTFTPHVIEPSFGIGRIMYTILEHNFKKRKNSLDEYYLSLPYSIAPYKCNILPLNESDKQFEPFINKISEMLIKNNINHKIDDFSGTIGRRYWRSDLSGIPYAITIDYETLKTNTVTIRDSESKDQFRLKIQDIPIQLNNLGEKQLTWDELKKQNK